MSIRHAVPVQPPPAAITHTTVWGFTVSGLAPDGWNPPPGRASSRPYMLVTLLDAAEHATGFEGVAFRDVFFSGDEVRALFAADANGGDARRRVEAFLVARGVVRGILSD